MKDKLLEIRIEQFLIELKELCIKHDMVLCTEQENLYLVQESTNQEISIIEWDFDLKQYI